MQIARSIWQWLRSKRVEAELSYDGSHVRVAMPYDAASGANLQFALDATTAWNVLAMQASPLPDIYSAGVRYRREPMCRTDGVVHICEEFLTAHEAYARGAGDCDDLGPWLASQRRLEGDPHARAIARRSKAGWHIIVARSDGSIEDPSAKLGMPTS